MSKGGGFSHKLVYTDDQAAALCKSRETLNINLEGDHRTVKEMQNPFCCLLGYHG